MSEGLFFIGILPLEEIRKEITDLKKVVAEKFGSTHALNSPSHITLHMPFKWKDKKIELLYATVREINSDIQPFEVELKDFGFFEPRVVFVNVVENEALNQLQKLVTETCRKELKLDNANYKNQAFHPHITIGFRDLRKKMFYKAQQYFKDQKINRKWKVEGVVLLKHDGERWQPHL